MAIPYRKFFKIMQNHELQNGELRVPKKFVKMYWKLGIPNPIFLKLPNGRAEWKIFWVERDGDIWFQKNWENFAQLLKYGYNLNFEYLGGPNFKVEIFDCTSLEIDYSNIINCGDIDVDEVSDECVEILDESKIQALKRKKSKRKNNIDFDSQQTFSAAANRGNKAKKRSKIEAMNERAWNSHPDENPNFEIKLSRSYVHTNLLILPREFGKKPWIGLEGTATISVGEAIWKVNFKFSNSHSTYFMSNGWKSFTQENNLQVGDVCKFEMIQSKPAVIFRITINRASRDEPRPEQLQDYESPNMKGNTFKVSVKSSDQLFIPIEFLKRHNTCHEKLAELKVGAKSWFVKVMYYPKYHYGKFSEGWPNFMRESKLKIGDTCLFEMIDEENLLFNVSIAEHHH